MAKNKMSAEPMTTEPSIKATPTFRSAASSLETLTVGSSSRSISNRST